MGFVLLIKTDMKGQKVLCQKHDYSSKKKTMKHSIIFQKLFRNLPKKCNQTFEHTFKKLQDWQAQQ